MPTTYELCVPEPTAHGLILRRFTDEAEAAMSWEGTDKTTSGREAKYKLNLGNPKDPVFCKAARGWSKALGMTYNSVTLSTKIRGTSSSTEAIEEQPVDVVITWRYAGKLALDATALTRAIQMAVAIVLRNLDGAGGNPTTALVQEFERDVLTSLFK